MLNSYKEFTNFFQKNNHYNLYSYLLEKVPQLLNGEIYELYLNTTLSLNKDSIDIKYFGNTIFKVYKDESFSFHSTEYYSHPSTLKRVSAIVNFYRLCYENTCYIDRYKLVPQHNYIGLISYTALMKFRGYSMGLTVEQINNKYKLSFVNTIPPLKQSDKYINNSYSYEDSSKAGNLRCLLSNFIITENSKFIFTSELKKNPKLNKSLVPVELYTWYKNSKINLHDLTHDIIQHSFKDQVDYFTILQTNNYYTSKNLLLYIYKFSRNRNKVIRNTRNIKLENKLSLKYKDLVGLLNCEYPQPISFLTNTQYLTPIEIEKQVANAY